jgi:DNA ligase (NAD+)
MNEQLLQEVMEHRYRYYVLNNPIISDYEYDILENKAKKYAPETHDIWKPGSSLESSYSKEIINKLK